MSTALVVIDVQQGMFVEPMKPYRPGDVLVTIRALQDRARTEAFPVLHVQHDGGSGHPLARGTSGFAIHARVAPAAGEDVVVKEQCDAFLRTGLDARLRALGIGRLVIAGMQTEYCVDTTIRAAFAHGYKVVLAADAHTTFDSAALKAPDIVAHHNAVLRDFATVAPAAEVRF
ncbi:MAG: cysteine hydrolase [Acidobacteria bacterium]|nr:cysteine hydrolase [Acidobacteriota bacterium]